MATPLYYEHVYFQQRKLQIRDRRSLDRVVKWADDRYAEDDTDTRFKVAYSYWAAAERLRDLTDCALRRSSRLLHFAGHHLRRVEDWNAAGRAYRKAGEVAVEAQDFSWAVRSFGRAKVCFADVGDAEEMAAAYVLEQDARRSKAGKSRWCEWIILSAWKLTSQYGQSWKRWLGSLGVLLVVFTVIYHFLHSWGWVSAQNDRWYTGFSGFFFFVGNITTLEFHGIQAVNGRAQAVVLINLALGWILLGIGAGMIARRVKER